MPQARFGIGTPPGFRLDLTVWALRRRPHNQVDAFDGTTYRRTLLLGGRPVAVAVRQRCNDGVPSLSVVARADGRGPALRPAVEATLVQLFGLVVDLGPFRRLAAEDSRLADLERRFSGMRPPRFPTVFEGVANAIACQQLSLDVGIHLLSRLAARYGDRPEGSPADQPMSFPSPTALATASVDDLRRMGYSRAKGRALIGVSEAVASGAVDLEGLDAADDDSAYAALTALTGIGRWSAEYTLLRGLGRLHVLPGDDVGARNNLSRRFGLDRTAGYDALADLSRQWWPAGGVVYLHLLLDALAGAGLVEPTALAPDREPAPPGGGAGG